MKDLRDRVAVITGGASGIGYATAEALTAVGMKVALADIEAHALEKAVGELSSTGAEVVGIETDVTDPAAVDALAKQTLDRFGAVHVVFNNAGVEVTGSLWDSSLDALHWVVDVNLWGVIHGIRTFAPLMHEQGTEGHILSTASMAGLTSGPFLSIYNATKHAVVTLSESLHKELALLDSAVKVSVVCPGFIQTRIMDSARNRPTDTSADPDPENATPGAALLEGVLREGVETGLPASAVADLIVDAIRNERFYVIPAQSELAAGIDQRCEELMARRNPEVAAIAVPEPD